MKTPTLDRRAPFRRRGALAGVIAAAVVVLALVVVAVVLTSGTGRDDGPRSAAATATSAPATQTAVPPEDVVPAAPVMPEATGPTSDANVLPAALPAVGLGEAATSAEGVSAEVLSVEGIDGSGSGPGNIAGPALRVTVALTNGTAAPIALDFVSISLTHGTDGIPASPLNDPTADPFTGTLQAGTTGKGVYVFSVPEPDRDLVTVSVGHRAGAPYLVFSGAAD